MASGLFSTGHWLSGTTRPSGVLQYTWRIIFPWPHDPEHCNGTGQRSKSEHSPGISDLRLGEQRDGTILVKILHPPLIASQMSFKMTHYQDKKQKLTGPHSDMVQWRSQGGPVQFLMFGGLVIGSHGLVSSEHRTSRVTWALRPHLAGHWKEAQEFMRFVYCKEKCSSTAHTSVHSATSHCGPQAGLLQGRLSMGRSRSAMVQSSL